MNPDSPGARAHRWIRQLIWIYFWLLLIEGALRKWLLPELSNPLLVIRDPVALCIYLLSFRAGVFPKNRWVIALAVIGLLCTLATFLQLWDFLPPVAIAAIAGYGIHSNYFHLPLIFVIGEVFTFEDVKRVGWWTLIVLLPMTLLMIAQFRAGSDAFVNRTAGGEGEMLMSAMNKVRTSGSFSFVIGVVAFLSLATGYIVWGILNQGAYKIWLLAVAGAALIIGIAVSGSRSVVGACAVVVASLGIVVILRPDIINRFGRILLAVVVLGFVVSRTPIFREGYDVLSTRFAQVAEATEQSIPEDLFSRVMSTFGDGIFVLNKAPGLGYGLGVGTNVGSKLLGHSGFLLMEGEWPRVILENGPVLGPAFLLWRLGFVAFFGWQIIKKVRLGNILPLLLFASSFLPMISGQFGQPTILGFAVFVTGLALAATKEDMVVSPMTAPPAPGANMPMKPVRGRSAYAERLHGTATTQEQTNGSAAR